MSRTTLYRRINDIQP
ncbi:hypothetical protein MQH31_19730 [Cryobacterium sp. ZS14-85]|nr:hypothetical protein [Cryobacterium zhongshanensis]MCI4660045.1 hypothetical protein [Cryobacterium zhongshanensis]